MQMYVLHRLRRSAACSCVRSYPPVRSADLSGQVLDTPLALEWGRRILEEFRLQAALEATAGLPLTTVASGDMETTMKGQHFFAAKVGAGCWLHSSRVGWLSHVRSCEGCIVANLFP